MALRSHSSMNGSRSRPSLTSPAASGSMARVLPSKLEVAGGPVRWGDCDERRAASLASLGHESRQEVVDCVGVLYDAGQLPKLRFLSLPSCRFGVADQRLSVVVTSFLSLWASARMPVSESASRRPSAFGSCSATTSPSLSSRWRMEVELSASDAQQFGEVFLAYEGPV